MVRKDKAKRRGAKIEKGKKKRRKIKETNLVFRYLDSELIGHLFQILDVNRNGVIDFPELVSFLYGILKFSRISIF